jgi:hypothetical protein
MKALPSSIKRPTYKINKRNVKSSVRWVLLLRKPPTFFLNLKKHLVMVQDCFENWFQTYG